MAAAAETQPPRKRLSAEDRRAAILDAALEVFAKRGYNGASIDEIAQAAGISKALIYEHFPSKKDLHVSLLDMHVQELFDRLAANAATEEPGEVRLRNGLDAFFGWVEDPRRVSHGLPRRGRPRGVRRRAPHPGPGDRGGGGAHGPRADGAGGQRGGARARHPHA